jgi:hypothetical protein
MAAAATLFVFSLRFTCDDAFASDFAGGGADIVCMSDSMFRVVTLTALLTTPPPVAVSSAVLSRLGFPANAISPLPREFPTDCLMTDDNL